MPAEFRVAYCPFCGTEVSPLDLGGTAKDGYFVRCPSCRAQGPVFYGFTYALRGWNRWRLGCNRRPEPFARHAAHDWESADGWCFCGDCSVDLVPPTEAERAAAKGAHP